MLYGSSDARRGGGGECYFKAGHFDLIDACINRLCVFGLKFFIHPPLLDFFPAPVCCCVLISSSIASPNMMLIFAPSLHLHLFVVFWIFLPLLTHHHHQLLRQLVLLLPLLLVNTPAVGGCGRRNESLS